ncbi:hypothetical protein [Lutispora saccharofermentans]|uniref:DUF4304 domain-containing protein n=1 Tax=Lutispora saccharofermentans TaxID=3024236 RepID=A0ABT1NMK5_9FIRM|nr:hypothetical protein [Lutispora saccharofermentans]MCQ1531829.1 hypothetical protein [Lutispora saccharofermentans]
MDKKALQRIIKDYFTTFAKQYNFVFYKSTVLLRVCEDTLHIINFDLPSDGLNCNIAIQPLYIPSDTITLSFGNRLNHFKTKLPGAWGYSNDKKDIERDLSQIKELLEINAIPWFNEVGRPEGIISFIESGLVEDINIIVGFPSIFRNMYLGFSYLYTNKIGLAEKLLQQVVEQSTEDKRAWVVQQNKMINSILALAKNEPNKIGEKLNEFVRTTKDNLKIKI